MKTVYLDEAPKFRQPRNLPSIEDTVPLCSVKSHSAE